MSYDVAGAFTLKPETVMDIYEKGYEPLRNFIRDHVLAHIEEPTRKAAVTYCFMQAVSQAYKGAPLASLSWVALGSSCALMSKIDTYIENRFNSACLQLLDETS